MRCAILSHVQLIMRRRTKTRRNGDDFAKVDQSKAWNLRCCKRRDGLSGCRNGKDYLLCCTDRVNVCVASTKVGRRWRSLGGIIGSVTSLNFFATSSITRHSFWICAGTSGGLSQEMSSEALYKALNKLIKINFKKLSNKKRTDVSAVLFYFVPPCQILPLMKKFRLPNQLISKVNFHGRFRKNKSRISGQAPNFR